MVASKIFKVEKSKKKRGRPKKKKTTAKPIKKVNRIMSRENYNNRMNYLNRKLTYTLAVEEQEKYKNMIKKLKSEVELI